MAVFVGASAIHHPPGAANIVEFRYRLPN